MQHSREDVTNAVHRLFPGAAARTVLELLDQYGIESHEPERERVQMAILKLSEGVEDRLLQFLAAAKQDYREVLYWAEYPEASRRGSASERRSAKQYSDRIEAYCNANGVVIPAGFHRHPASQYAAIDVGAQPPRLVAKTWFKQADVIYYLERLAAGRTMRILDFKDGRVLEYRDGRLQHGESFLA